MSANMAGAALGHAKSARKSRKQNESTKMHSPVALYRSRSRRPEASFRQLARSSHAKVDTYQCVKKYQFLILVIVVMLLTSTSADEDTIVPALIVWVNVLSIPVASQIFASSTVAETGAVRLLVSNCTRLRSTWPHGRLASAKCAESGQSWANSTAVQVCLTAVNTIFRLFISVTVTDSEVSCRRHIVWNMSGPCLCFPSQMHPKSAVRLPFITTYRGAGDRPSTAIEFVERYAHHLSSKTVSRSIRDLLFGWRAVAGHAGVQAQASGALIRVSSLLRGPCTMAGLLFHAE